MAVAIYVVTLILRLHHDEAQGTLEPVLATAVSRSRWLTAYAANAVAGATLLILVFALSMAITGGAALGGTAPLLRDLAGAALVQLPAIGVLAALVATVIVVLPRWSVGLSWLLVVFCVFVGPMFGPSLGLPTWLLDVSPFTHVPNAPATAITVGPVLLLGLANVLFGAAAVVALRRRNLELPA
jgi:ABC-2 type transport system permease protein